MDQDRSGIDRTGSEDTSRAEEHVRNVEENRDALEAQARRTEATTSGETDRPIEGSRPAQSGGLDATGTTRGGTDTDLGASGGTGRTSEDTSEAEANVREVERNREALEAQHRRVESTTPPDIEMP